MQNGKPGSVLSLYRQAAALRRHDAFQNSNLQFSVVNEDVFSFLRFDKDNVNDVFLIIANIGDNESTNDYSVKLSDIVYQEGEVMLSNYLDNGDKISLKDITVYEGEFVVLKLLNTEPSAKSEL